MAFHNLYRFSSALFGIGKLAGVQSIVYYILVQVRLRKKKNIFYQCSFDSTPTGPLRRRPGDGLAGHHLRDDKLVREVEARPRLWVLERQRLSREHPGVHTGRYAIFLYY